MVIDVAMGCVPWYSVIDLALSNGRTEWASVSGRLGALGNLTKEAATIMSEAGHLQTSGE